MVTRAQLLREPVQQIELDRIRTVADLVDAFKGSSIQSRALGRCAQAWENALRDKRCTVILGMAGALIAGGLRKVIRDLIRYRLVDAVVTTGAIPYQDFYQARGYQHYKTSPVVDDLMLRKFFIDRIYDTLVDEDKFRETDAFIGAIAAGLEHREYSSREFLSILGRAARKDKGSWLGAAYNAGVPVFAPALNDSSIGIGLTGMLVKSLKEKSPHMVLNPILDNWELTQVKIKSKRTGVVYIAGGIPKNFIQQIEVIAETLGHDRGGHHYAVQLTTDAPHWGGLSGCTFEEAQSWGKINKNAKKSQAYVEATVGLPLLAGYLLQKKVHVRRRPPVFTWKGHTLAKLSARG